MQVDLSRKAQDDLDDIRTFSLERFGPERTIAYLDAVEATFRRIQDFPETGALDAALQGAVRSMICQRHRIYYSLDGDVVLIVRVLHQAMNVEQYF